jgi:hypothetical protein
MIFDGRTRSSLVVATPIPTRPGRGPGKRTTRTTRGPASFSQSHQVSHEASTHRPSACCLVRRPHACHRIGGDATKIHRPALRLRLAKAPPGEKVPMAHVTKLPSYRPRHACRSLEELRSVCGELVIGTGSFLLLLIIRRFLSS